ncbi:MAG: Stp1/IreP family PP2C-type Ser/Thr phosphatase [Pseudomonadota bacterium]
MEVTVQSHTGMLRDHNEDNHLVDARNGIFLVADGMGGHQAGEVASKLCVETVHARLVDMPRFADANLEIVVQGVKDAIHEANREIRRSARSSPERANMGTTLVLLLDRGDAAVIAHLGDSRIYRLREGHLQALTRDHSLLQEQVGAGFITHEEARQSHNRNLVTRALGVEENVDPEVNIVDVRPGDCFLLCSDGLNTMVADADIELVLAELEANPPLAAKVLVGVANDNGGHDNVTVALAWSPARAAPPDEVAAGSRSVAPAPEKGLFARLFGWLFGK